MEKKLEKKPYLLLYTDKGKRYLSLASKNSWTIGRGRENDVIIRDQCISRNHAILQSTDSGGFYLIDLGSRNGTFVNGRRVSIPVTLSSLDHIAFGKTKAEFYSPQVEVNDIDQDQDDFETMTSTIHQRQLISVVVTDIRDFTVLAQQLDEKVLSALIGNWFRQAGSIIRNAGSWVDKYIGDAVMAIWFHGEDQVTKDDLLEIFRAVKNLHDMTQNLSKQYTLPFPLRIGAGINTGHAMVGNTGSGDHPDYTAIGDTVNAAFRLESATKQIGLDVALGGKTFESLGQLEKAQAFFQEYTVTLKGYKNPTLTYGANFSDLGKFLEANDEKTSEL
ncbi:MAG: FHA domain-containing protein [Microcystaceae cyanobacterium]